MPLVSGPKVMFEALVPAILMPSLLPVPALYNIIPPVVVVSMRMSAPLVLNPPEAR